MKARVLVIEDEVELREIVSEILKLEGITPVEAKNGLEALQILKNDSNFDLILTDWNMPVMNGELFLTELNQILTKKIPVIVLSASNPPQVSEYTYLEKPFLVEVLLNAVKLCCESQRSKRQ